MSNERSKQLSFLLRHRPESKGLTLDKEGWCDAHDLCSKTDYTIEELKQIVDSDEKGRYTMEGWPWKIRANQGHSTDKVKLTFAKAVPPVVLYHGTVAHSLAVIKKEGLLPMNRHHVHLSAELVTAAQVGSRRKGPGPCIITVDAKAMLADGIDFFKSENGVWLVNKVDPKYFAEIKQGT